jgi:predicted nucleic acid-binding Zn ribbon protein
VSSCPRCGEPAEPGQLVCLECGSRIALKEEGGDRRSLEHLPAVALLLTVVVIGAAAFGFALSELTDDSKGDSSTTADTKKPSAGQGTRQTETETGAAQQSSRSLLLEWPKGLTAYTVVIVTSGDKPAAKRVAEEAAKSGLEAGLLKSDDYDLGRNLWIVFAGRFDTRQSAERQAGNLGDRYPGAYATLVKPAG